MRARHLVKQYRRGPHGRWTIGLDAEGHEYRRIERMWRRVVVWVPCQHCGTMFPRVSGHEKQVLCGRGCVLRRWRASKTHEELSAIAKAARRDQRVAEWERFYARCRLWPTLEQQLKAAYYYGVNAAKSARYKERRRHPVMTQPEPARRVG